MNAVDEHESFNHGGHEPFGQNHFKPQMTRRARRKKIGTLLSAADLYGYTQVKLSGKRSKDVFASESGKWIRIELSKGFRCQGLGFICPNP